MTIKLIVSMHEDQVQHIKQNHLNPSEYIRQLVAENDPDFPVYTVRPGCKPVRIRRCEVCGSTDHLAVLMPATANEEAQVECPLLDEQPPY